jgi:ankyrin repeat protein
MKYKEFENRQNIYKLYKLVTLDIPRLNNNMTQEEIDLINEKAFEKNRKFLKNGYDINYKGITSTTNKFLTCTSDGTTALMEASANGTGISTYKDPENIEMIRFLLKHRADPNIVSTGGYTALYLAIKENHYYTSKLLLLNGAIPNIGSTKTNAYPLFSAIHKETNKYVKLLLKHGADINIKDIQGKTVLYSLPFANYKQPEKIKMFEYLLQEGVDINSQNNNGNTILDLLIDKIKDSPEYQERYIPYLKLLVEYGADINNIKPIDARVKITENIMSHPLTSYVSYALMACTIS